MCGLITNNHDMAYPNATIESPNVLPDGVEALSFILLGSVSVQFYNGDDDRPIGGPNLASSWTYEQKCLTWPAEATKFSVTATGEKVSLDSTKVHSQTGSTCTGRC